MPAPFAIEERTEGSVHILSLIGSLDGHTFVEFEKRLEQVLGQGTRFLVLDLSQLNYIASAGVGIMVNCLRRVKQAQGNIVLHRPTSIVTQVIEVLGLASLFIIEADLDRAIAQAGGVDQASS